MITTQIVWSCAALFERALRLRFGTLMATRTNRNHRLCVPLRKLVSVMLFMTMLSKSTRRRLPSSKSV